MRRKLLAVIKSVEQLYKFVYQRKLLIRTDHATLKSFLYSRNPESQIAGWIQRLEDYDDDIKHGSGFKHQIADSLCLEDRLNKTADNPPK